MVTSTLQCELTLTLGKHRYRCLGLVLTSVHARQGKPGSLKAARLPAAILFYIRCQASRVLRISFGNGPAAPPLTPVPTCKSWQLSGRRGKTEPGVNHQARKQKEVMV